MSTEQLERTYSDGRMDLTKLRRKPIITFNGEIQALLYRVFSYPYSMLTGKNYSPTQQVQYAYKGWIAVKRVEIENATRGTLTNVTGHAMHALINTAS
jgi:hypothetical protein